MIRSWDIDQISNAEPGDMVATCDSAFESATRNAVFRTHGIDYRRFNLGGDKRRNHDHNDLFRS